MRGARKNVATTGVLRASPRIPKPRYCSRLGQRNGSILACAESEFVTAFRTTPPITLVPNSRLRHELIGDAELAREMQ